MFEPFSGDSGGPLVCRSNGNPSELYLAGITSSGYNTKKWGDARCGESNTYSTFTKTSLFTNWIDQMKNLVEKNEPVGRLLQKDCPGVICNTIKHCVKALDGVVDCLHGEDEISN